MKKLVILFLALLLFISPVNAKFKASTFNTSYNKLVNFYKKQKKLTSPDEIIAVEILGLEAESSTFTLDKELVKNMKAMDKSSSIGDLTKVLIAISLLKQDPYNYNGKNYVKILEDKVKSNGDVKDASAPNQQVWVLIGLMVVNSPKAKTVAKNLITKQLDSGAFYYEYNGDQYPDDSTTAWTIEALTILDKTTYASTIKKAVNYLLKYEGDDASFDSSGWGANADSQAPVLEGLLVYNKTKVTNGSYDKNGTNPFEFLYKYQAKDGSFQAANWQTGDMEYNAYTTLQVARTYGTYKNGSFITKAKKEYKKSFVPKSYKLKAKKKAIKVTHKKVVNAKYQIAYRKKGTKKWKYKTVSKKTYTIKKLKKKTKYQVKVRSVRSSKSAWTKVKTIKTK